MKRLKNTFKGIFFLLTLTCGMFSALPGFGQQKTQFTQYMYDGSVINPAYVGADEALSLTFISRNQWAGVEGAPSSQTLSAHTLFQKKQFGLGVILQRDKIGIHQNFNFSSNYAYHLKVGGNQYLSFGMQAGVLQRNSDYGSLGNDPSLGKSAVSSTHFDLGLGLYFRSRRLHLGYSAPEIIPRQVDLNEGYSADVSAINHFLFGKYIVKLNKDIELQPSVLLKFVPGLPLSYDLNFNTTFKNVITAGVSYRKNESMAFLTKLQVTPQLQFGYAYDYPIGNLTTFTRGSHEIVGRYIFKFKYHNVASPR